MTPDGAAVPRCCGSSVTGLNGQFNPVPVLYIDMLARTSIGAVSPETRDAVAAVRDEEDLSNYDEAVRHLLERAGEADRIGGSA